MNKSALLPLFACLALLSLACGAIPLFAQPTATPVPPTGTPSPTIAPTATPSPTPSATPSPTPEPTQPGGTRTDPYDLGETVPFTLPVGGTIEINIQADRGISVLESVRLADKFNPPPPSGMEYVLVIATIGNPVENGGAVEIDRAFYQLVDPAVPEWDFETICCMSGGFPIGTIQPGESLSGQFVLPVRVDDPEPTLVLGRDEGGADGVHFNLPGSEPVPEVLFEDDFSSTDSGWTFLYRDETGITDYDQGGFRIQVLLEQFDYWANPERIFTDTIIDVDAAKLGGPDDNDFGVICRHWDEGNFYFFLISSDGYFTIGKYSDGDWVALVEDGWIYSGYINQGDADNHIQAECTGSLLRLSVNGTFLYEVEDDEHYIGDVGLIAGTFDTPGTDILFDNFVVRAPVPSE